MTWWKRSFAYGAAAVVLAVLLFGLRPSTWPSLAIEGTILFAVVLAIVAEASGWLTRRP